MSGNVVVTRHTVSYSLHFLWTGVLQDGSIGGVVLWIRVQSKEKMQHVFLLSSISCAKPSVHNESILAENKETVGRIQNCCGIKTRRDRRSPTAIDKATQLPNTPETETEAKKEAALARMRKCATLGVTSPTTSACLKHSNFLNSDRHKTRIVQLLFT